ncbi:prepilin-type N-terminal cleavage/methylation domain-containing protein [Roseateles asaccharophilus]|uniref:Type IV pilus assembly protein PilW n=1 Tax=Roseateles asaccharophilus TaxID=582607 RepID=A0ABU2A5P7_9BURK|nr:prepilin-type N-terminal cleavage/methylation domain-containing protein [Roseateles asaccharophilus]MDR7332527.1 type IV pilus assembly protein PilW [Roseateles asaccharophilus]
MLKPVVRSAQRGLGLVELMVGITVGLIVAAGASMVAVNQINEHRRLMLETQVQQDLRVAADLMQQDLRRAGFRGDAALGVWRPASGVGTTLEVPAQAASASPYAVVTETDNDGEVALEYRYARPDGAIYTLAAEPKNNEFFGIRWDKRTKALYLKVGLKEDKPNWQPITDPETVEITQFQMTVHTQDIALTDFCDSDCAGAGCPKQQVRQVDFLVRGRAKHDANVVRTLSGTERIRADAITGACPVLPVVPAA